MPNSGDFDAQSVPQRNRCNVCRSVNNALIVTAAHLTQPSMKYQSIEELNIADALRHLVDARRMKNLDRVQIALDHLQIQLDLVKDTRPDLYKKYADQIE